MEVVALFFFMRFQMALLWDEDKRAIWTQEVSANAVLMKFGWIVIVAKGTMHAQFPEFSVLSLICDALRETCMPTRVATMTTR